MVVPLSSGGFYGFLMVIWRFFVAFFAGAAGEKTFCFFGCLMLRSALEYHIYHSFRVFLGFFLMLVFCYMLSGWWISLTFQAPRWKIRPISFLVL